MANIGKSKAIILGTTVDGLAGRPRNIGDAIGKRLRDNGWRTWSSSCYDEANTRYDVPVLEGHGDATALVCCLGTCSVTPFPLTTEDEIQNVVHGCLTLPLLAVKEFITTRSGVAGGDVVLVGSYNHNHPLTNGVAYSAAKAGLSMAAKALAWELSPAYSFYVVHPYHVPGTPLSDRIQHQAAAVAHCPKGAIAARTTKDLRQPVPLTADEVAQVVHLLLREPVARWLSGSGIEMYGGTR